MTEVGVNSYITPAEATGILIGNRTAAELWTALSTEEQEYLLKEAAIRIDGLPLSGRKKDKNQNMAFPRENQTDVPDTVKSAQALEAAAAADSEAADRRRMQEQGVMSVTVGQVSESYSSKVRWNGHLMYSNEAYMMLRKYIAGSFPIV